MPVSSSGHLVLLPELLGWAHAKLDPELRKSFEVALHAGTAAALAIVLRAEVAEVLRELDPTRVARHAAALAPPALAVLAFERTIEERLGSSRSVATAQVAAGLALGAADRRPATRERDDAGVLDHALIGLGQAAALVPGVSRNGATLTAARLRRFRRGAANRLSRHAALPIIVAATALKGHRLSKRGLPPTLQAPFLAGATAAFASTLACRGLIKRMDEAQTYAPYAAYRVALGAAALALLKRGRT